MNEFVQLSDEHRELGNTPVAISSVIFGIAWAGAGALGLLATSVIAFLAPPAVLGSKPEDQPEYPAAKCAITGDAPRLRLVSRTSRTRSAASQSTIALPAAIPLLARDIQMKRVSAIVEDATIRSVALRQLHERTRTQIDAAEQAIISLRNELAAVMPDGAAQPYGLLAA